MMLYKDIGGRAAGKSTRLLKLALSTDANIAVYGRACLDHYVVLARVLGVPANKIKRTTDVLFVDGVLIAPLSYYLVRRKVFERKKLYIDELDHCLAKILPIAGYTVSEEEEK